MPSTSDSVAVPSDVAAVARRYSHIERPASVGVAVAGAGIAVAPLFFAPYVFALLWIGVVLATLRVPLFRTSGRARFVSDAPPESVVDDFESATPPMLGLQWGVADTVRATDDGATYEVSYLLGLRTTRLETHVTTLPTPEDAAAKLELTGTRDGSPWGTYEVTVRERDGGTVVDAEWESDRRFGLRRLPQSLVARRYRADALEAQGYDVERYDSSVSL